MSDIAPISRATYACSQCSKTYKRREHLHRHEASHSAVRPYRCGTCNQSYQRPDVLRRHSLTCQAKVRTRTSLVTNRRACDFCVRQKKACSNGKPCDHCRSKSVECSYSFDAGAVPRSNASSMIMDTQTLAVVESTVEPPNVVFGDDSQFDYLGNYTSVSDMLEGSYSNQDWLDFVNLTTGHVQLLDGNSQTRLDNYKFHFLDNFTSRSGLVESFDCGTHDQRIEVVKSFLGSENRTGSSPNLHDPLSIQTHQILLGIKEIVTTKPRNSVVELEWSPILEQICVQFFCPRNLRKFLALYWHIWHPNVNFVHRPTFEPVKVKSTLVAAMALIGRLFLV